MDKETLSNYGWIVITVLVLAVMLALATPFASYIKTAVENTTDSFITTANGENNDRIFNAVGLSKTTTENGGTNATTQTAELFELPTSSVYEIGDNYFGLKATNGISPYMISKRLAVNIWNMGYLDENPYYNGNGFYEIPEATARALINNSFTSITDDEWNGAKTVINESDTRDTFENGTFKLDAGGFGCAVHYTPNVVGYKDNGNGTFDVFYELLRKVVVNDPANPDDYEYDGMDDIYYYNETVCNYVVSYTINATNIKVYQYEITYESENIETLKVSNTKIIDSIPGTITAVEEY